MSKATIIGVDLAKNVFQPHGAAADGTVTFRKKLSRRRPAVTAVCSERVNGLEALPCGTRLRCFTDRDFRRGRGRSSWALV
jgi:hypothetical protein